MLIGCNFQFYYELQAKSHPDFPSARVNILSLALSFMAGKMKSIGIRRDGTGIRDEKLPSAEIYYQN